MLRKIGIGLLGVGLLAGILISGSSSFALAQSATVPTAAATPNATMDSVTGGGNCAPVGGTFIINFVDQTNAAALLTGDLAGAARGLALKVEPGANGVINYTTTHAITTQGGDLLMTSDHSVLTPVQGQDKMYFFSQVQTVTGGTGRYANATGTLTEYGAFNAAVAEGVLRYTGHVCTK